MALSKRHTSMFLFISAKILTSFNHLQMYVSHSKLNCLCAEYFFLRSMWTIEAKTTNSHMYLKYRQIMHNKKWHFEIQEFFISGGIGKI